MGPQDGVDTVIRLADDVVHKRGRTDIGFALLGFGDCYDDLRRLSSELGLDEHVEFTGRADARMIAEYLSTADVGISPDRLNPLNDVSTMNKVMEYMAYATPVLSFDLKESRETLGGCGVVVSWNDDLGLSCELMRLLDDEDRRVLLGVASRNRCASVLDWAQQRERYVGVYDALLRGRAVPTVEVPAQRAERRGAGPWSGFDEWGHRVIDLREPGELAQSIRLRAGVAAGVLEDAARSSA
jgi:glycosyltransferase involved in cell wall biosynthesis